MLLSDLFSYFMFSYSGVDIAGAVKSCPPCFLFLFVFLLFFCVSWTQFELKVKIRRFDSFCLCELCVCVGGGGGGGACLLINSLFCYVPFFVVCLLQ